MAEAMDGEWWEAVAEYREEVREREEVMEAVEASKIYDGLEEPPRPQRSLFPQSVAGGAPPP